MHSTRMRKILVWTGQVVVAAILFWFVGRSVFHNWNELGGLEVTLQVQPLWIFAAAITVWFTYGLLIEAWRRILLGWGQHLHYAPATRIWCLSNLGRYLPGKVWSVAALAVLAQRAGVAPWAAAGSAIAMQAMAIGTGAIVVGAGAPTAANPIALACAFCVAGCAIVVLASEPMATRLIQLVRPGTEFRTLPIGTVLLAAAVTLMSWAAYGMAFLMLAHGIFEVPGLSVGQAIGVFAAGYIVGLLALFAPGGVGVRELVFVALLAPVFGSGGALALSIASRLLLTGTEVSAALAALLVNRRREWSGDTTS